MVTYLCLSLCLTALTHCFYSRYFNPLYHSRSLPLCHSVLLSHSYFYPCTATLSLTATLRERNDDNGIKTNDDVIAESLKKYLVYGSRPIVVQKLQVVLQPQHYPYPQPQPQPQPRSHSHSCSHPHSDSATAHLRDENTSWWHQLIRRQRQTCT